MTSHNLNFDLFKTYPFFDIVYCLDVKGLKSTFEKTIQLTDIKSSPCLGAVLPP